MDIYNHKRNIERNIERINESSKICKANKKVIIRFKDYLSSENIGPARINRYLFCLIKFNELLGKPFEKATKEDIRRVVSEVHQLELSEYSKKEMKILIRKLYRFLRGVEEKGMYPDEVRWISIAIPHQKKKLPEELLTDKEIADIVRCCLTLRDKALIATLAESGCRVSEIATMQVKHVSFEQYGARLVVNGKTGMRKILVVTSSPYLQEWINSHPFNNNPNAILWQNTQHKEFLCYHRIADILKDSAKRAGIKKRVHPHLLRHSKATALASVMSDAQLKSYLGWTAGSKMAATYVHLSGKETDDAILRANNLSVEIEKKEPELKSPICPRCRTTNSATNRFCRLCGFALNIKDAEEIIQKENETKEMSEVLQYLLKDKEVLDLLSKKLKGGKSVDALAA